MQGKMLLMKAAPNFKWALAEALAHVAFHSFQNFFLALTITTLDIHICKNVLSLFGILLKLTKVNN